MTQSLLFGTGPLAVSDGLGVDSQAMLELLRQRGERPDLIMFADVGGEKDETYRYLPIVDEWCERVGFPKVTVVKYVPKKFKHWPPYYTLEDNCLTNGTLPSLAFGFKSCSLKWKVAPQNAYCKQWAQAIEAWARGAKVTKFIGYDASAKDMRRRNHVGAQDDPLYDYRYPLIEAGWDRTRCIKAIVDAGLPVPCKSSCFFCPAMQPIEICELDPKYLRRIVVLEARAAPRLEKIEGLWRNGTKTRPGSITEFIRQKKLLPEDIINGLIRDTPTSIVEYQNGFAAALKEGRVHEFEIENVEDDYRTGSGMAEALGCGME